MRRWILVDYDAAGLRQIQARDEHPRRFTKAHGWFTDAQALALARQEAASGDEDARIAAAAHDEDAAAIEIYRERQRQRDQNEGRMLPSHKED